MLAPGFLVYMELKEAEGVLAHVIELEAVADEAEPAPPKIVVEVTPPRVEEPKPVTPGGGGDHDSIRL